MANLDYQFRQAIIQLCKAIIRQLQQQAFNRYHHSASSILLGLCWCSHCS